MTGGPDRPAHGPKVLYIEDDAPSRLLIRCLLEAHRYRVLESDEGLSGIETALRETPRLILLDLHLPDVDGQTVAAILRSFPKLARTPIVGITAHEGAGLRERTLVAGCDGYITKPIDPDRFPTQIAEFLAGKREVVTDGEELYLRELNQQLVCRLLLQLDELRRLHEQTARRARRLEAVHDAMYDLSSAMGLAPLLDRLLPGLADALGASEVTVELSHPPGTHLSGRASAVPPAAVEATEIEWKFPLVVKDRPLGFLVARYRGGPPPTVEDEHLFKIVANHVAIAVENARLLETERTARLQTEAAERRAAYLARVSAILSSSLDLERTLSQIAGLAIPDLGGVCIIDFVERDGETIRRPVVAIADPTKAHLAAVLRDAGPATMSAEHPAAQVLRTGQAVIMAESTGMIVPLTAPDRVLGTLTLLPLEGAPRYGPADLNLAEDLASRAGLVLAAVGLYQELQQAHRRQDEFLASVAHQLRTPLAPILDAAEVIGHYQQAPPAVQRARQIIDQQVRHQARLVEDLLDLARIGRGGIELRLAPLDLCAVVTSALVMTRPAIESRGHRLTVSLPPQPLVVLGDQTRLEQVLVNLLTNAARYTPPAGQVSVSVEREGDVALIRVRDSGKGIPRHMLRTIFDMFTQVEPPGSPVDDAGFGIGLALVHRFVELHGGRVAASSEGLGRGSEFTVRLPASAAAVPAAPAGPGPGASSPRRLLIVEDNRDAADALRLALELHGHHVEVAASGSQGVSTALTSRPEVVLSDLGLPDMDGYEVARRIRAALGREVMLVALTGHGQPEDRRRSEEAGFDAYLLKPVSADEIGDVIARWPPRESG
jgi:signal transduction histidine kinase/DNA-binding response OmpR family regulator